MTAPDASAMPDWGSTSKLSSLAAAGLILVADVDNGKVYSGGTPKMTHQIRGVKAYDPRARQHQRRLRIAAAQAGADRDRPTPIPTIRGYITAPSRSAGG
jgi:hypothetical protein